MPKPEEKRPVRDRLAHQEFLRALAGLVVIVDRAVGGVAEAVEAVRDVAERQRRVEDLRVARPPSPLGRIDHLQRVARREPRLVVHVVGEDVDEVLDQRPGMPSDRPVPQSPSWRVGSAPAGRPASSLRRRRARRPTAGSCAAT